METLFWNQLFCKLWQLFARITGCCTLQQQLRSYAGKNILTKPAMQCLYHGWLRNPGSRVSYQIPLQFPFFCRRKKSIPPTLFQAFMIYQLRSSECSEYNAKHKDHKNIRTALRIYCARATQGAAVFVLYALCFRFFVKTRLTSNHADQDRPGEYLRSVLYRI